MAMIRTAVLVMVLLVPHLAAAAPSSSVVLDPGGIEIIDGDTIRIARGYRLGPNNPLGHARIRLLAIDAPELHSPRCDSERIQARAATARLRELVEHAAVARILLTGDRDKYHRPLARLVLDDTDVADVLLRDGLALPWRSGRAAWMQRGLHWCPDWQPPPREDLP